jgi:hypothetical protein
MESITQKTVVGKRLGVSSVIMVRAWWEKPASAQSFCQGTPVRKSALELVPMGTDTMLIRPLSTGGFVTSAQLADGPSTEV